jgi:hypothetical protein
LSWRSIRGEKGAVKAKNRAKGGVTKRGLLKKMGLCPSGLYKLIAVCNVVKRAKIQKKNSGSYF